MESGIFIWPKQEKGAGLLNNWDRNIAAMIVFQIDQIREEHGEWKTRILPFSSKE
jgi:hypothetical protein